MKKLKLLKYFIGICIFLMLFIGYNVYATDVQETYNYLLPMTIDYGTKSYMIYDEKAAIFATRISLDAYENPETIDSLTGQYQWDLTYRQYEFEYSSIIENEQVVMNRVNREYIDDNGNSFWQLEDIYSSVNVIIGVKTIEDKMGNSTHLISIAFRGTGDLTDILTDVNITNILWKGSIHQGFYNTATAFYERSDTIMLNINGQYVSLETVINEMKNEDSQYKMIVTGHSLGGAVANVFVGHTLRTAGVKEYNVTAYTFGAPRTVTTSYANSANVKNIINIINTDDWVPMNTPTGQTYFGETFFMVPSEATRQKCYDSSVYVPGKNSDYYAKFLNFLTGKGMHDIETYRELIVELKTKIQNYTTLNTINGITVNNLDAHIRNHSINYIDTNVIIGRGAELTFDSKTNINITGGITQQTSSRVVIDKSNVFINGNYTMNTQPYGTGYLDISSGKLEIGGDLTVIPGGSYGHDVQVADELIVHGNANISYTALGLKYPTSYMKIYGNATFTLNGSVILTEMLDGTIEVLGNYSCNVSTGGTKIKLSGEQKQIVTASVIPIIELANFSQDGIEFVNKISITNLFNHNNLHYTLKNGAIFVDYDGDGVKDNLDYYPMDPTKWTEEIILSI